MKRTPIPSAALVADLAVRFPNRCPDPEMTDREIWLQAGSAQVVTYLRTLLEDAHQTMLEDDD